jgi:hypothetical protein
VALLDTLSKLNTKSTLSLDASEESDSLLILGRLPSKKEREGGLNDQVQHLTYQVGYCHDSLLSPSFCRRPSRHHADAG